MTKGALISIRDAPQRIVSPGTSARMVRGLEAFPPLLMRILASCQKPFSIISTSPALAELMAFSSSLGLLTLVSRACREMPSRQRQAARRFFKEIMVWAGACRREMHQLSCGCAGFGCQTSLAGKVRDLGSRIRPPHRAGIGFFHPPRGVGF